MPLPVPLEVAQHGDDGSGPVVFENLVLFPSVCLDELADVVVIVSRCSPAHVLDPNELPIGVIGPVALRQHGLRLLARTRRRRDPAIR